MLERKIIHNSNSFKDLDKTLKKLISKKKTKLAGSIFELLTKLYFEVSPEYKTKLSKVYLLNEVPTKLKQKLRLPNTDEGIDLICVTFDNEYWAIQCKYRSDNSETLKVKGDLATFNNLAFTVCKNISHGIVCATVNRPPKKTKLLNVGYILLTEWLKLDRNNGEIFNQIKAKAIGKIFKPKKLSPRPHQKSAINKSISHFKKNSRGKMIMPCGTGKSLTAFWIAEKMKPKSILVAVPSLALLQQTLKVWTREFLLNKIQPDWLCVCSDDTVKEDQDDFVTYSADLGIKVDTDPRVVKNFLKKKTSKLKIVFTTYQSGRATAIGSRGHIYDFGIMDEAHKTVGSGSKPMAHLLSQKNIKIKKRLFMTATERLFRGDRDEYMSMDDPRDYGDLIFELSFKDAINSKPKIISDYKIITIGLTNPEIELLAESNKFLEVKKILKDITARELATALALRKAIKKLKIKNAISFHRSIKRAQSFREQQNIISKIYPTYSKLKTFHVKGNMPASDRALEMLAFEQEKGLMTNARCLTEGVDLPAIDCVCFTDPKRSKVDIVQAAGRALRLSKGKKFGYILIPIIIPDDVDFNLAAKEQGFEEVSSIVRALATTDKRIVEYLRVISEGKKPNSGSPVDGITSINNLYKVEAEKFDNAIQLKVWDKVSAVNLKPYAEAKKIAQLMNIRSNIEWNKLYKDNKIPKDIPSHPDRTYKNDWEGWGTFLNTGRVYKVDLPNLKKLTSFIQKKKIKSAKEYVKFWRQNKLKNSNFYVTAKPDVRYKNLGWKGWPSFLGNEGRGYNSSSKFCNFKSFVKICTKYNIDNSHKYKNSVERKKDLRLPSVPEKYYKEWKSWPETFNLSSGARKSFLKFKTARKFARNLKFTDTKQWREFVKTNKKPLNIPAQPQSIYKKEFKGFKDFLGYEKIYKGITDFENAKKIIRTKKINFKSARDYVDNFKKYKKKYELESIPTRPDYTYKSVWKGWPDFLGKK